MRGRSLKALIVITLALAFLSAVPAGAVAGPVGDEKLIFSLLNAERREAGLSPLKWGGRIAGAARVHSLEMVDEGYFSHVSPISGSLTDRLRKSGLTGWLSAGENLAGAPTAEVAFDLWLNSPLHYRNMLKASYDRVGIGVARGGPYGAMFTMDLVEKPSGGPDAKNLAKKKAKKPARGGQRTRKAAAKRRAGRR